jgi:transposase
MLSRDARIRELERMVGKLTMENELLKKAAQLEQQMQSENSSIITGPNVVPYKRGVR